MAEGAPKTSTLFLCGDVMTGRGIDQAFAVSADPELHESYVKDARDYIRLAEMAHGEIPRPITPAYLWGAALEELRSRRPTLRIINLETSVTNCDDWWRGKGIHYRMHPDNLSVLQAAGIDGCILANNHVLDWGHGGLVETLSTLETAGIATIGAGQDAAEAWRPTVFNLAGPARIVVLAFGTESAGVPADWSAGHDRPGVAWVPDLSGHTLRRVQASLDLVRHQSDITIVSIHWGSNWGYHVPQDQVTFAHRLIDEAGVDIVHGHSSHHPRPIEVYKNRLILYGCGDFFNDYEGIAGHEQFRSDLVMMVFPQLSLEDGRLVQCTFVPLRIHRFQLQPAGVADLNWLADTLNREGRRFSPSRLQLENGSELTLDWPSSPRSRVSR